MLDHDRSPDGVHLTSKPMRPQLTCSGAESMAVKPSGWGVGLLIALVLERTLGFRGEVEVPSQRRSVIWREGRCG